jgi:hypothetical protein
VRQLSNRLNVRYGVASRWVSENPKTRVIPLPGTLVEIANVLELDVLDVFRHAGIPSPVKSELEHHPHEAQIRIFKRQLEDMLTRASLRQWPLVASVVTLDLDHLRSLLARLDESDD